MKKVAILGSTGTIGRNTLDVIRHHQKHFRVTALAAGSNIRLLEEQIREFRPEIVSLERKEDAEFIRNRFKKDSLRVTYGLDGVLEIGGNPGNDIVVSAITGINGLKPTLAAVRAGKSVALANKESMVVAGSLLRAEARKSGARIIPVDSEHSGVLQCLAGENRRNVKKVTLTASGGPFFRTSLSELRKKTVEEALAHPRWKMGKKVTVDSATLMNKGLELIEARWLFDFKPGELDVLIHPQSIVHALVEMRDGSVLAQLSPTDMKIPIQFALTYPEREDAVLPPLDLARIGALEFYPVEAKRYPLIRLATWALREGGSAAVALNAANEVAVEAFLARRIGFLAISDVVHRAVDGHEQRTVRTLDDILDVDRLMRERTSQIIQQRY
ncbi:MAG: 1-deoxy-D-xylulose-5-phosphate reductoisomerase [Candidatus Aminicenantes bacterium]|nr:1-deoxy-D-xylulose-5-phosphate reductoisomerase [Candidatus Aminicenantes bacterium]